MRREYGDCEERMPDQNRERASAGKPRLRNARSHCRAALRAFLRHQGIPMVVQGVIVRVCRFEPYRYSKSKRAESNSNSKTLHKRHGLNGISMYYAFG